MDDTAAKAILFLFVFTIMGAITLLAVLFRKRRQARELRLLPSLPSRFELIPEPTPRPVEAKRPEPPKAEPKVEAPAPVVEVKTETAMPKLITVDDLARADNLLIVGNRGSGKTTLLAAILRMRRQALYVADPHNEPGKWHATRVIGGGRAFQEVYSGLQAMVATMDERAKAMNVDASARAGFVPFTLAGDEWGSVNEEITFDPKAQDAPGKLVRLLLKEGRKFKISFIASAHGDTNASLGCTGDKEAFANSFDWFIYMGAFVAGRLTPEVMKRIPLGKNPEGGTFPLVVVAYSPTTRETRLLDLHDIADDDTAPVEASTPIDLERHLDQTDAEDSESEDNDGLTDDARKLLAFIRRSDGMPSHTAMRMHLCGYTNDTARKRVDQALLLLEERGFHDTTTA